MDLVPKFHGAGTKGHLFKLQGGSLIRIKGNGMSAPRVTSIQSSLSQAPVQSEVPGLSILE